MEAKRRVGRGEAGADSLDHSNSQTWRIISHNVWGVGGLLCLTCPEDSAAGATPFVDEWEQNKGGAHLVLCIQEAFSFNAGPLEYAFIFLCYLMERLLKLGTLLLGALWCGFLLLPVKIVYSLIAHAGVVVWNSVVMYPVNSVRFHEWVPHKAWQQQKRNITATFQRPLPYVVGYGSTNGSNRGSWKQPAKHKNRRCADGGLLILSSIESTGAPSVACVVSADTNHRRCDCHRKRVRALRVCLRHRVLL